MLEVSHWFLMLPAGNEGGKYLAMAINTEKDVLNCFKYCSPRGFDFERYTLCVHKKFTMLTIYSEGISYTNRLLQ